MRASEAGPVGGPLAPTVAVLVVALGVTVLGLAGDAAAQAPQANASVSIDGLPADVVELGAGNTRTLDANLTYRASGSACAAEAFVEVTFAADSGSGGLGLSVSPASRTFDVAGVHLEQGPEGAFVQTVPIEIGLVSTRGTLESPATAQVTASATPVDAPNCTPPLPGATGAAQMTVRVRPVEADQTGPIGAAPSPSTDDAPGPEMLLIAGACLAVALAARRDAR